MKILQDLKYVAFLTTSTKVERSACALHSGVAFRGVACLLITASHVVAAGHVVSMRWFGFGFNAFGQICDSESANKEKDVKVSRPTELSGHEETTQIRASWSRRASLHLDGESVRVGSFHRYVTLTLYAHNWCVVVLCQVTAACGWQASAAGPAGFAGKRAAAVKTLTSANRT